MCSDFSNCSRLKMSSTTELTELKELPKWAKHYEERYNLAHFQEIGFVKALISLDTIAKKKPEIAKGVNDMINALCTGLFSDFDEEAWEPSCGYDYSIGGLVRGAKDLGLDAISTNAVNGVYDHGYVIRRGENYERKSREKTAELFQDLFGSMGEK